MPVEIVDGDLLDQDVEAIVNAWNRNTIPWWLLLPQGVSGAIKKRAGAGPFRELAKFGRLRLGQAVMTGPGRLKQPHIIHVAGINDLWRGSIASIRFSTSSALELAVGAGLHSIAFPIIGAGSGGVEPAKAEALMLDEMKEFEDRIRIVLVRYQRK